MCFFRGTLCSLNYSGKILSLQGSGLFLPTTTSVFQTSSFLICQAFIFCCSLAILRGRKLFSSLKDFHFLEMDTSIHYLKSMTLLFRFLLLFLTNYDEKFGITLFNLQPFKFYHHQGVCYTPAVHAFKTCFLLQRLKKVFNFQNFQRNWKQRSNWTRKVS